MVGREEGAEEEEEEEEWGWGYITGTLTHTDRGEALESHHRLY